jgi:ribosome modulation factor
MDDDEPLLLHEPDLMLALMRAAKGRPAGLDEAAARITATLAAAREPAADPAELRRSLGRAAALLVGAGVLSAADPGTFRLTESGARLLAEHPDGVDQSVLERLPAFRAYLAARAREHAAAADRRESTFDAGFRASRDGRPLDANPFDPDTPDHQVWENGWCDGRDRRGRGEDY